MGLEAAGKSLMAFEWVKKQNNNTHLHYRIKAYVDKLMIDYVNG